MKEFEREASAIVEKEVESVKAGYVKKNREVETQFKIKRSTSINASRLETMQARNKTMLKLFSDAQFSVLKRIQEDKEYYKGLLKNFMVQGFIKLYGEQTVIVRCLKRDVPICKSVIGEAVKVFTALIK